MAKKLVRGLKSKWTGKSKEDLKLYKDSVVFLYDNEALEDHGSHIVLNGVDFATLMALDNLATTTVTVTEENKGSYPGKNVGDTFVLAAAKGENDSAEKIKLITSQGDANDKGIKTYKLVHTALTHPDAGKDSEGNVLDSEKHDITKYTTKDASSSNSFDVLASVDVDETGHVSGYKTVLLSANDEHVTAPQYHYDPTTKTEDAEGNVLYKLASNADPDLRGHAGSEYSYVDVAADGEQEAITATKTIPALIGFKTDSAGHVINTSLESFDVLTEAGVMERIHQFAESAMHIIGSGSTKDLYDKLTVDGYNPIVGDTFTFNTAETGINVKVEDLSANTVYIPSIEVGDSIILITPNDNTTIIPGGDNGYALPGEWTVVNSNWEVITNPVIKDWEEAEYYLAGDTDQKTVYIKKGTENPVWVLASPVTFETGVTYKLGESGTETAANATDKLVYKSTAVDTKYRVAKIGGVGIDLTLKTPVTSFNGLNGDLTSKYSAVITSDSANASEIGTLEIAGEKHTLYATAATYDDFDNNPVIVQNDGAVHTVAHGLVKTEEKYILKTSGQETATEATYNWIATETKTGNLVTEYTPASDNREADGSNVKGYRTSPETGEIVVITDAKFDGFGHVTEITKSYVPDEKVTADTTTANYTLIGLIDENISANHRANYNAAVKVTADSFVDENGAASSEYGENKTYDGMFLADSRGTVMSVNAVEVDWEEL